MNQASWQALPERVATIEQNWLFELKRAEYRSVASGRTHDFYLMEIANAVVVIALTRRDEVVLVRQFRVGSGRDGLEPPGGLVDSDEDVLETAARELLEETGYEGDAPRVLGTSWSNPSIMNQRITTVLITNAACVAKPALDENEELEVELVPAKQVPGMILDGRVHHSLAVQGLLLWLTSQLPGSPWSVGDSPGPRRWQFRIQALLLAVFVSALAFAAARTLGRYGTITAAILLAGIAPAVLWRRLDWRENAILLRDAYFTPRAIATRTLASIGAWSMGLGLIWCVIAICQSLRLM